MATLKPIEGFRVEVDVEALHDALQALKDDYPTGVSKLIELGGGRSENQKDAIVSGHQRLYDEYAPDVIKKDVKGYTGKGLWALYSPAAKRDATWLREAMVGLGTNEPQLAEIICTRNTAQLKQICEEYKEMYAKDLVGDVEGETSGYFRTLLVKLLTVPRGTSPVNKVNASKLAQELYDAGQGKWGTDSSKFIEVLTTESVSQLREVFSAYLTKFHTSIIDAIKSEFGGHMRDTLIVLVRAILDPAQYFCDKISTAVEGLGTDEDTLIRVIIGRASVDLQKIKTAFAEKYKNEMAARVAGDVGGDFQELLLAIIK